VGTKKAVPCRELTASLDLRKRLMLRFFSARSQQQLGQPAMRIKQRVFAFRTARWKANAQHFFDIADRSWRISVEKMQIRATVKGAGFAQLKQDKLVAASVSIFSVTGTNHAQRDQQPDFPPALHHRSLAVPTIAIVD
jgi:hypothetical protein